jgi:hypothetical protein
MNVKESSYFKKWWLKLIRERNYFGFRYWWFNWLMLVSGVFLFIFYFFRQESQPYASCCNNIELNDNFTSIYKSLENCCICDVPYNYQDSIVRDTVRPPTPEPPRRNDSIPKPPSENCRAFFSGRLVTDDESYNEQSEYVGSGFYPEASQAFPNSTRYTFDGIAAVAGTRIIIYEKKNFQGRILLDVKGPALINNGLFKNHSLSHIIDEINTKTLRGDLNNIFPKTCRKYSDSDMHSWSNGSLKIICDQ